MSLYHTHRPVSLDEVVGQPAVVRVVKSWAASKKWPKAMLFKGPSGVGKTTVARIVVGLMGVSNFDATETNCAIIDPPLDHVRRIANQVSAAPIAGPRRVWVLDEVQSLTRARFAQEALLKILEDCPAHVHFVLCTTDPKKIIPMVLTRCSTLTFNSVRDAELGKLVRRVAAAERVKIPDDIVSRVVAAAGGSPRTALVELDKVVGITDDRLAAESVGAPRAERAAFDLVKELLPFGNRGPVWKNVAALLEEFREEEPEGVRQMLLSCCRTAILKGDARSRAAYRLAICLEKPYPDRSSGAALLAANLYEAVHGSA